MKKVFFLIFLSFLALNIFAQGFSFGPEIGLTSVPLNKTEIESNTNKLTFYGAAFFDYKFNDWLALRLGANYIEGSKSWYESDTTSVESFMKMIESLDPAITDLMNEYVSLNAIKTITGNTNLAYLRIPISAVFNLSNKIQFSIGGYYGFLLRAHTRKKIEQDIPVLDILENTIESNPLYKATAEFFFPEYYEPEFEESTKPNGFALNDYGFLFSATYQMENRVFIKIQYSKGFADFRIRGSDKIAVKSITNSLTTISIGYSFGEIFTAKVKKRYNIDSNTKI